METELVSSHLPPELNRSPTTARAVSSTEVQRSFVHACFPSSHRPLRTVANRGRWPTSTVTGTSASESVERQVAFASWPLCDDRDRPPLSLFLHAKRYRRSRPLTTRVLQDFMPPQQEGLLSSLSFALARISGTSGAHSRLLEPHRTKPSIARDRLRPLPPLNCF